MDFKKRFYEEFQNIGIFLITPEKPWGAQLVESEMDPEEDSYGDMVPCEVHQVWYFEELGIYIKLFGESDSYGETHWSYFKEVKRTEKITYGYE